MPSSQLELVEKRLLARRHINPASGCWEYMGSRNPEGYGKTRYQGRHVGIHRLAAMVWKGLDLSSPDAGETWVLHSCDNPACFNPDHLELGSPSKNQRDAYARGRKLQRQAGQQNNCAKLSARDVQRIRALLNQGKTNIAIAAEYGVHHSTISMIRRGKNWSSDL